MCVGGGGRTCIRLLLGCALMVGPQHDMPNQTSDFRLYTHSCSGGEMWVTVSTVCCARSTHVYWWLSSRLQCHTIVGPSVPVAYYCGSVVIHRSSHRHTSKGIFDLHADVQQAHQQSVEAGVVGRSWGGCSQAGHTTVHPMTAMTSSITVVTCIARPRGTPPIPGWSWPPTR